MDMMDNLEYILPLTARPNRFIGEKPVAILIGEEKIEVDSWRDVYIELFTKCYNNPEKREMLESMKNNATGKAMVGKPRFFLSDTPNKMIRPLKIDDDFYAETHYGAEALMRILINRILVPVGFDCSNVNLILKKGNKKIADCSFGIKVNSDLRKRVNARLSESGISLTAYVTGLIEKDLQ